MRVAIDTNGLYTGQAGTARHIRGFLRGLDRITPPVDFFPLAWEVTNLEYRQPVRTLKTVYRELIWAHTVAHARLRRGGADLFHATGSYFVEARRPIKRIVTLHDLAVLRHPERFRKWHRWSEARRLHRLGNVDQIICISRFTANEAIELLGLPARQMEVVYNGCDFHSEETIPPEQKPDFELPGEFFLFVGSLEPGKNLSLLRAAYELGSKRGEVLPPLLVVGARWAGVAGEGAPPAGWQYLGRQSDAVLQYLYRRALALLFPSKYEGFGLPVAEAMALGCPVVCSPVASLPEVGGTAACYCPMEPQPYLESMLRIAGTGSFRDELVSRGLEQARRFSWSKFARETVELYKRVHQSK